MNKRRPFTLLEVLLAITIIMLAMPVLITPFVMLAQDYELGVQKMQIKKASQLVACNFLIAIHQGVFPEDHIHNGATYEIPKEWLEQAQLTGSYSLEKVQPTKNRSEKGGLWKLVLRLQRGKTSTSFSYLFGYIDESEQEAE